MSNCTCPANANSLNALCESCLLEYELWLDSKHQTLQEELDELLAASEPEPSDWWLQQEGGL